MKITLTNGLILMASFAVFSSCSKDEFVSAGWDQEVISTSIVLDQASIDQINLGTINISEYVEEYVLQNHAGLKSYRVLEARPTFGLVASTDVLPLGFVGALNIYAVLGNEEILIGEMSSGSSQDASFGLAGLDVNLIEFAGYEPVDFVLRPQFNDLGVGVGEVDADVTFAFNFLIDGLK